MRFENLDLNLLVALDVLLRERNTTVAADKLCLSQSSVSGALGRLREYFDDELLRPVGRTMVLTPRAEDLKQPVRNVLDRITTEICQLSAFDPKTTSRHLSIVASDYAVQVALNRATAILSREAPKLVVNISSVGPDMLGQLESRDIDLLIGLEHAISDRHPSRWLFDDEYVAIACAQNSQIGPTLDLDTYCALGHVAVQFGRARLPAVEEDLLRNQNVRRRIEILAPNFSILPSLVIGTNRIATMQRRLVESLGVQSGLKVYELPLPLPKIRLFIQWHRACADECALTWIVDRIVESVSTVHSSALPAFGLAQAG